MVCECNEVLWVEDWFVVVVGWIDVIVLEYELCDVFWCEYGCLMFFGVIVNIWSVYFVFDGYVLEFDCTELFNECVDFEIEIEFIEFQYIWEGVRIVLVTVVG